MSADSRRMVRIRGYRDAGITVGQHDVDWLIAEVERLQIVADFERESAKDANAQLNAMRAERDRYKAWHDGVMALRTHYVIQVNTTVPMIARPQPLKENE